MFYAATIHRAEARYAIRCRLDAILTFVGTSTGRNFSLQRFKTQKNVSHSKQVKGFFTCMLNI